MIEEVKEVQKMMIARKPVPIAITLRYVQYTFDAFKKQFAHLAWNIEETFEEMHECYVIIDEVDFCAMAEKKEYEELNRHGDEYRPRPL